MAKAILATRAQQQTRAKKTDIANSKTSKTPVYPITQQSLEEEVLDLYRGLSNRGKCALMLAVKSMAKEQLKLCG